MPELDRIGHRIAEVSYRDNRLVCTCGVVLTAEDGIGWRDHRRSFGLRVVTVGQSTAKRLPARV